MGLEKIQFIAMSILFWQAQSRGQAIFESRIILKVAQGWFKIEYIAG